jgi:hypothetical protein
MNFYCRSVKPTTTPWTPVEADSAGEAANQLHLLLHDTIKALTYRLESEIVSFVQFEVKSGEKVERFNSRIFSNEIRRKAGVKKPALSLQEIADQLEHEGDPQLLIAPGWSGEEEEYKWGV